jgi:amidase
VHQFDHFVAPTADQLAAQADRLGIVLDDEDARLLPGWLAEGLGQLEQLEDLPEDTVPLRYPLRDPGRAPIPDEDPFNAFIRLCAVSGAESGPLAGRRIAIKDCIAVAGVPQTEGGGRRPYLVPTEDAVAVERVLAAGATIVGKTNMEDAAVGSGEGSHFGATRNPRNPEFTTGGSSSGSAAAVASGAVELALGSDQAGSIRTPAAWCGVVGMKPTHGLVPSSGLTHMDHTIDHIGPMTRSVEDNALLLSVIAGYDERDPQWSRERPPAHRYGLERGPDLASVRIGVLAEAERPEVIDPDVLEAFGRALEVARTAGADIRRVHVPLWSAAVPLLSAVVSHGLYGMWLSHGLGFGHLGRVDVDAVALAGTRGPLPSHQLPPRLLSRLFLASHLNDVEGSVPLARAHNLRLQLRHQIDRLFDEVDVVLTPTVSSVAFRLLAGRSGTRAERMTRGTTTGLNTCALDLSGHPALSIPCGTGDHDLPVGLQLIGPHFGEDAIYRTAYVLEERFAAQRPSVLSGQDTSVPVRKFGT